MASKQMVASPIDKLKSQLSLPSVREQFDNALKENSQIFTAALLELVADSKNLQKCEPRLIVLEALKAATLKLPINKSLGFAYIVPYADVPQMQIGWRGLVQLAMRTGQYRCLNADAVYAGEFRSYNKLSGELDISGAPTSTEVVGYFAHMETVYGFRKTVYMTAEQMQAHAVRFSKAFNKKDGAWQTNYDEMAKKTMMRRLLTKYGILSIEVMDVLSREEEPEDAKHIVAEVIGEDFDEAPAKEPFAEVSAQIASPALNPGF